MVEVPSLASKGATVACLPLPTLVPVLDSVLRSALEVTDALHRAQQRGQLAARSQFELGELINIAGAINSERDIKRLLGLILEKSRDVTGADAGSVYVLVADTDSPQQRALRFEVAQNESLPVDFESFTMPISERSIVGAAVLRREIINIPDLYELDQHNPWGVSHDRSFDERTGYQTRSLLSVPLINQLDEVIGVIQLINKKRTPGKRLTAPEDFTEVIPFDEHSVALCRTLASQAGISLENALLYDELRQVFEGFVEASVQAIEARDPTTSGHSRRVADLTVGLAEHINGLNDGPYRQLRFTHQDLQALEYAGLLHDFGKIGVPEAVLLKAEKLHEHARDLILARFDYIRQCERSEALARKLELASQCSSEWKLKAGAIDDALARRESFLDSCVATILAANRPTLLPERTSEALQQIASERYVDPRGESHPYLQPWELECLSISRGSLSAAEREQIESHVIHTFNYLCSIPWGKRFRDIPAIAGAHHEKLDGTGYPRHKSADDISIPARMMAIADIFDALTASDRPYKKAVPCDRALDILAEEARRGKLDKDLLQLFISARVYERVLGAPSAPPR
jgi:HD-GYP domain-containing protein (c-di-GMP phosphodiesterase class II)